MKIKNFLPPRATSLFFAASITLASGIACAQTTLTAAVDYTLRDNPDIAIDSRYRRSVDEALAGAYSGYLPRVDVNWGAGREKALNSNTGYHWSDTLTRHEKGITLQQMLFDSFATKYEVDRNRARMESAAHKVQGSSEQIALKVVESYLDVLRLREIVRLTRENLQNHQKTYDQISMRAHAGVGRQSDVDQAAARLALAKSNLVSSEANLRDAEIAYQRNTGMRPDEFIQPEGPGDDFMPQNLEDAMDTARENNPLLKQSKADIEAARAQHNAAKSAFGPRFDLQAGMDYIDNSGGLRGENDDKYVMVRMNWNLIRGGADNARVGETKQLLYQAMEIMKRTQMQLDESTSYSWNTYQSAKSRLPNLRDHADSSRSTRDAYSKQFVIGQRTLIDLLDTENEYYTSTVEYTNGLYLELFARYRLMADEGLLLSSLGVNPPEEANAKERVEHSNRWSKKDYEKREESWLQREMNRKQSLKEMAGQKPNE
ncbi:MAG: TolC family outer membrane protein [Oxalobacter formigenes]|nr:TolC family outer membrane protein [Oxalobacter formigenes]